MSNGYDWEFYENVNAPEIGSQEWLNATLGEFFTFGSGSNTQAYISGISGAGGDPFEETIYGPTEDWMYGAGTAGVNPYSQMWDMNIQNWLENTAQGQAGYQAASVYNLPAWADAYMGYMPTLSTEDITQIRAEGDISKYLNLQNLFGEGLGGFSQLTGTALSGTGMNLSEDLFSAALNTSRLTDFKAQSQEGQLISQYESDIFGLIGDLAVTGAFDMSDPSTNPFYESTTEYEEGQWVVSDFCDEQCISDCEGCEDADNVEDCQAGCYDCLQNCVTGSVNV